MAGDATYSKDDFFDLLSCDALRAGGAGGDNDWRTKLMDQKRLDLETFGGLGGVRHGRGGGGRHGGGGPGGAAGGRGGPQGRGGPPGGPGNNNSNNQRVSGCGGIGDVRALLLGMGP